MRPRLNVNVREPMAAGAIGRLLAAVPPERRHRTTIRWNGTGDIAPGFITTAREAGFSRVRVAISGPSPSRESMTRAVRAGANEIEIAMTADATSVQVAGSLRASGAVEHLAVVADARSCHEPAGNVHRADELIFVLEHDASAGLLRSCVDVLGRVVESAPFRLFGFRGIPPCMTGVDPAKVLSNSWNAEFDGGFLAVPFEDPERVFIDRCARCRLSLACDGLPARAFRENGGSVCVIGMPGDGSYAYISLAPAGLACRCHPRTPVSGKIHLLSVLAGIRPCGRMVIRPGGAAAQARILARLGLRVESVEPAEAPRDFDSGGGEAGGAHIFFSRVQARAREAAALEKAFARNEHGSSPSRARRVLRTARGIFSQRVPGEFAAGMGRLLGYPDCCIAAFAEAGTKATVTDLVRRAFARSKGASWLLNCLDPRSPFTLIPHIPCRFDCEASIAMARKMLEAIPAMEPFLDGAVARALRRPALFLDASRVVVFDGRAEPGRQAITYGAADMTSFRPDATMDPASADFIDKVFPALVAGDRVEVHERRIRVSSSATTLLEWNADADPLVVDFQ